MMSCYARHRASALLRRVTLLVVVTGVAASQAAAATLPPPSRLVARVDDISGLTKATVTIRPARSAEAFAALLYERTGTKLSRTSLEREGFLEAVRETINAPAGEVFSTAMVYRSPLAARQQEAKWITQYRSLYRRIWISRPAIRTVPGSLVAGVPSHFPRELSEYRLAFFSVGSCAFLETVIFTGPQLHRNVADTLASATTALYQRARTVCR
jgi:hypothetical protein